MDSCVLLSLEEKVARYPSLSDSDIVQQILAAYGVTVQADSTATTHQENDTTVVQRERIWISSASLARRNGFGVLFRKPTGPAARRPLSSGAAIGRDTAEGSGDRVWRRE